MSIVKNYNFEKVFSVFKKNYIGVPLEIFTDPYEALISTLMSSRTNDDTTLPAAKRLFARAKNFSDLKKLSEKEIAELIYPVGFYKTKAKNIKKSAERILSDFDGAVPETRDELIKLPGVGRKTANLVLVRAFKKPAISVDTHVHRITNMLHWVDTKNPEQTERELTKILPKKYWRNVNRYFVSVGRQHRTKRQMGEFLKEEGLL